MITTKANNQSKFPYYFNTGLRNILKVTKSSTVGRKYTISFSPEKVWIYILLLQ